MIHIYVYYNISSEKVSEAQHALALFCEDINLSIGLRPQILKRQNDPFTWMEVYMLPTSSPDLPAILDAASSRSGLTACLEGGIRHTECFVPL